MRRTIGFILGAVLAATMAASPTLAQKAQPAGTKETMAVVDKLIEALGGRKTLESIKDMTASGTAEVVEYGLTVPITIYQKEPDKLRLDITIPEAGMTIIQAYDGRRGWSTNPQTGATEEMPDFMTKELARQAAETRALLQPEKIGVTYALKPKEAIEGKDHIVLEQTRADGHKTTFYLDPDTYLPAKTATRTLDQTGVEVEAETYSTDYRKVAGTMVAYSMRVLQNGVEAQRITLSAVSYNTNLDDSLFSLR